VADLTDAQASAALTLTTAFKAKQNRDAAKIAALVALYYQKRVNVEDMSSVESWLDLMIPRIIATSDSGARDAANFYTGIRRLELPNADRFTPEAALGQVDEGVRKSLLVVGPYDYMNKAAHIRDRDVTPLQQKALLAEAKLDTTKALTAATVRHAQAGGRQTIYTASGQDRVALGWVRVTRAKPCHFCAMLASRGLQYRAFKEGAFDLSNDRFTGDGDAKVHDDCGCSLKPVFTEDDPVVSKNQVFVDLWERWGAGGGDAMVRFRRGYDQWRKTGEYISWDKANEGLRAA
jgi:hypothetical protein